MVSSVLLVDDDELIRRIGGRSLSRAGFHVSIAGSSAEALVLASQYRFDVAVIDYFLGPGDCGCDLVGPLRGCNPAIHITVISGLGVLSELVCHAYSAGADRVTSKTGVDWIALARGAASPPPLARPAVDLTALKREVVHGAFLVHRRNVSRTARALGLSRSTLQRTLRQLPPLALEDDD